MHHAAGPASVRRAADFSSPAALAARRRGRRRSAWHRESSRARSWRPSHRQSLSMLGANATLPPAQIPPRQFRALKRELWSCSFITPEERPPAEHHSPGARSTTSSQTKSTPYIMKRSCFQLSDFLRFGAGNSQWHSTVRTLRKRLGRTSSGGCDGTNARTVSSYVV